MSLSGRPRSGLVALWVTLAAVAAFAAREVTRAALAHPEHHWILKTKLLGVAPSISLLVGTIAFVSARHQFALAQRPLLTYGSGWIAGSDASRMLFAPTRWVWKVTLRNAGPGTAVMQAVSYDIDVWHEGRREQAHGLAGDGLFEALRRYGLEEDRDLSVALVSPDGALEPRAEARLCELPSGIGQRLLVLDVHITYRSLLGDRFSKTVRCVPVRGLPTTPDESAYDARGAVTERSGSNASGKDGLASPTDR
ncbi:MAG: hypothetical protein ACJ74O_08325 [Frankiaceae bacterium]